MTKILFKKDLANFISYLRKKYRVFASVKKDTDYVYAEITEKNAQEIDPDITILPPKKLLFPSREVLFNFEENEIWRKLKNAKPIALVGLPAFDINALSIFDKIMSSPKDNYYWQVRKDMLVVGIGKFRVNLQGKFDLFFEERKNEYLAIFGSNLGKKIAKDRIFKNSSIDPKKPINNPDLLFTDQQKLSKALIASQNDKLWNNLAKICFGCGICAYVCPLCYCFDIKDNLDFNKANCQNCAYSGKRVRQWDACFLPHFFEISGHNFKPKLKERIFNWYYHKFVRMPKEFGHVGCVSCERCIKYCPAKINYREVLEEILAKYS